MKTKLGLVLAGVYVLAALYFIATQGLTGESFIAILLGLPWTLGLAAIEFGGADGMLLNALLILPVALNAYILYWLGNRMTRRSNI